MKILLLIILLMSGLLADTVRRTEFHSKNYNLILVGKWSADMIQLCEEDSQSKSEELTCKIDTSTVKVVFIKIKG